VGAGKHAGETGWGKLTHLIWRNLRKPQAPPARFLAIALSLKNDTACFFLDPEAERFKAQALTQQGPAFSVR